MSADGRILLVGGDTVLRDVLAEQLGQAADLDVATSDLGISALGIVETEPVDLVVTDMTLPDMDGALFVGALRKDGFRGPIVMLTTAADDPESGIGLDAGATESIARPFRFAFLLSRIRAQLRAHEAAEEAAVSIGPYTFRAGAKTLTSEASGLLRLTEKEAAILRFLHRAGEGTVSRDTLLQEVWGYNAAVTTHTLETHIYRLRQKIEADPSEARILVTEPGGYRLAP